MLEARRTELRIGLAAMLVVAACGGPVTADPAPSSDPVSPPGPSGAGGFVFPPAPSVTEVELDDDTAAALDRVGAGLLLGLDRQSLSTLVAAGDPRLGWVVADLLRFHQIGPDQQELIDAFETLVAVEMPDLPDYHPWQAVTDHLIAWDLPAPPGYLDFKRSLFIQVEPAWEPFFSDEGAEVDWRLVSWGGVFIDDRPLGDVEICPRGCIPALDDPPLTAADEGDWYPDTGIVFGVVIGGEAVALPKNMMEVHEMVNITLGGRRLGIPYCTLCGSAQAYFLDQVPGWQEALLLRTSGLLTRSNKMMFDLESLSLIDTFTGVAISGPLRRAGVALEQTTVVASLWGDWKVAHPDTSIVASDAGLGRVYPDDPLRGRDDAGPIFPIGDVDPRMAAQAAVIGVISRDGVPIAFPAELARTAVAAGEQVEMAGVTLQPDGTGFRALADNGQELAAHQAFWFAWSQFHPTTLIWEP